ncbi:hypothetical protein ES332_D10G272300v1 [Gossypium tomentosum]|uniref:Uncharacterized protein n=1 Tax=Gossypium tomentosum TaxID=34277 RepID=A0A5D2JAD4_GOSTO|nr:hypothetical protein ES332_D10G272300v1 [Gossypium tomentosum]
MDERMTEAAQTGDINLLYELILNDPYVLERIDDVPFFHTPLHVAASVGHIEFMMEMIKLKPTFARKLNQAGFSPMHLALQNDRTHAVLRLLRFDEGLVRVKGREDLTPLHHVVQNENLNLLKKFLEKELLSWPDIDGNTVLHIAAIRNRPRVANVLLEHMRRDQINAKNLEGLTALDIQSQYPWNERQADKIIDMLSKAGGLSGSSSSLPSTSISSFHIESLKDKMSRSQKWATRADRGKKGMAHEMRNTFLVVTVLIITTTYEASLNPPKKPDDSPSMKYQVSSSEDEPLNSHTFLHKTDFNTAPIPSPSAIDVLDLDDWTFKYSSFLFCNTFTFWVAVFLTALLLPPHSFSSLILLTLSFFGRSYMNLFDVSAWSWGDSYEFSNENAHLLYVVASFCNVFFSTLLVVLVSYQTIFYVCSRVNITKPKFFFLLLVVVIGCMVFMFG